MSAVIEELERAHAAHADEDTPVETVDDGGAGRGASDGTRSLPGSGDSTGFSFASLSWLAAVLSR